MYNQLIPEQRSQIFALLQSKTEKKVIASIVGVSVSTIYREIKRNSTAKGHYLWDKAPAYESQGFVSCFIAHYKNEAAPILLVM